MAKSKAETHQTNGQQLSFHDLVQAVSYVENGA